MRTFLILGACVLILGLLLSGAGTAAGSSPESILVLLAPQQTLSALSPQLRLTPILKSLQAHQQIKHYEWLADANAFRIEEPDRALLPMLGMLPGVSGITSANVSELNRARQAQRTETFNQGWARTRNLERRLVAEDTPFFEVNETWDQLEAKGLAPNQGVEVTLKDSGAGVKAVLNLNAEDNGQIHAPFGVDVVQGDSVEIKFGATNFTIHSIPITIDFDFANNRVTGTANANHTVFVHVQDDGTGWCERHEDFKSVTANGGGSFTADFNGSYDVIRRTETIVTSMNDDGYGWTVSRRAPWLVLNTQVTNTNGNGYGLAPDEDVEISLRTGATEKSHNTSHTNSPDANFGFGMGDADMLPGDTLTITENGNNWATIQIVALTVLLNPKTGAVSGQAPANQQVVLHNSHYNPSTGNREDSCQTVTANGAGAYSASFAGSHIGGDSLSAFFVDGNGFEQQVWDTVPQLLMYSGLNLIEGMFQANFDGEVEITVTKKTGDIKYQGKAYALGGWWSQRLAKNGTAVKLAAKDTVSVRPRAEMLTAEGTGTLTAQVVKITATLDVAQDKVSGTAPKNTRLLFMPQLWGGYGFDCRDECGSSLAPSANSAYTYGFRNDLTAGDYVDVFVTDAKGHRSIRRAFSTTPTIAIDSAPATFRRGRQNPVRYTVANGQHVMDTGILFDSVSRPDWRYTVQNGPEGNWWPGGPGQYQVNVGVPFQGKIYYRAFAWIDGRYIITTPESNAKAR